MNKYVIHGSHYKDNFGDTLLLQVILDALIDMGVSKDKIYAATASNKVCADIGIKKASLFIRLFSDKYIYGGGGYFGEPEKNINKWSLRFIVRHIIIGTVRRFLKKKYIFVGTGFGPLTNKVSAYLSAIVLNGADYVFLRDKKSVEFASEISGRKDIIETADLVPAYINYKYKKHTGGYIVLHMHLPVGDVEKLELIIKSYISFRNDKYPNHRVIIINDSEDDAEQNWFVEYIREFYQEIDIHKYHSFIKILEILQGASFVLTNKLHVSIVSSSMGINVASIYMHPKTPRYFEQINKNQSCIPLHKILDLDILGFLNDAYNEELDMVQIKHICSISDRNIDMLKRWASSK